MNYLGASFFSSQWFLVIILVVAIGLLMLASYSRKKKEETFRNDLNSKIVKGVKVKTYGGLYCTVENVTNTTDGKIVLVSSGEGDKKSYQLIHINAIFGVDEKENLVVGKDGNEYTVSELKEMEKAEAEQSAEAEKTAENAQSEPVASESPSTEKKSKRTKKSTTK